MKISNNGLDLLKQLEGCVKIGDKHVVYDDKTGKPVNMTEPLPCGATIGYGHLIKQGECFKDGISEKIAIELLRSDLEIAEKAVRNNICVPLSQNQYDALVALAYNIGIKNFAASTVVKYINNPEFHSTKYPDLESAWKAWDKSSGHKMSGLRNRRNREWQIFSLYLHTAV